MDNFVKSVTIIAMLFCTFAAAIALLFLFGIIRTPESPSNPTPTIVTISALTASVSPTDPPARATTASEAMNEIRSKGKLVVIASTESGPHSYKDTNGKFKGFEIDLVREMAKRWFASTDPEGQEFLKFIETSVIEREQTLRNNLDADFLAGAVSYTDTRCLSGDLICTNEHHFIDKSAVLARFDSNITSYCDIILDNPRTYFIVISQTTAQSSIESYRKECLFQNQINSSPVSSRISAFKAVESNSSSIYKTDRRIMEFYLRYLTIQGDIQSDKLKILADDGGKIEAYVFWIRKEKTGLKELIDNTIKDMRKDGTFQSICQSYFPSEIYCGP